MLNLSISAPGSSEASPSELAAVAVDSPLRGAAASPGSGGAEASGPGSFGAFLARAMSTPEVRALAGADGKSLPVSDLQTQLLGEETRLVMSAGSEMPGEESLYAFAIQQGMDPATVAAVLWPGMPVPPGVSGAAGIAAGADGKGQNPMLATAVDGLGLPLEAAAAVAGVVNAPPGLTAIPIGSGDAIGPSANASVSRLEQLLGFMGPPSAGAMTAERFAAQGRGGVLSAASGLASVLDPRALQGLDPAGASASNVPGSALAAGTAGIIGAAGSGKTMTDLTASPIAGGAIPTGAGIAASAGAPASRVDIAVTQAASVLSTLPAAAAMPSASQVLSLAGRGRSTSSEAGAAWATAANAGAPIIGGGAGLSSQIAGAPGAAGAVSVNGVFALQSGGTFNPAFMPQSMMGLSSESANSVDVSESASEPASFESLVSDALTLEASDGAESSGSGHHPGGNRAFATVAEPLSLRADELGQGASGDADGEERQAMTQRLAEGLAQRISAQIAQNNWKLQVELRPAHLGQVNIELAMTGGQLEARFDATQAASRAMIQEGLDRLRQDLEKSGMNVAYLGMQAGGGSSGGGKPTLRSRSGEPAQLGEVDAVREPVLNERSSRVGRDGLDVMV
jgi:hypothetical protein